MHFQAQSLTALLAAGWLLGCAPAVEAGSVSTLCEVGSRCTLEGALFVFRGTPASAAELRTQGGCYSVALAEADYRRYANPRGQRVRISGTAHSNSAAENVASVTIRDRTVSTAICTSGLLIYAEQVTRVRGGRS